MAEDIEDIGRRHGFGADATRAVAEALRHGGSRMAQFNHPELGGMGQWTAGGMIMIGDMFNQGLKHRVDELCNELASLVRDQRSIHGDPGRAQSQSQSGVSLFVEGSGSPSRWWPPELGEPASVGAQNEMRYAYFPASRRIAIQQGGRVRVYNSGEHRLSGFSQQQGGDRSLTFTSQLGVVRLADLAEVPAERVEPREPSPTPAPPPSPTPQARPAAPAPPDAPRAANEIVAIIESLAGLREKNIISEEEFSAKKAELLRRL